MNKINDPQYLGRENLATYSPKFSRILENVLREGDENRGLHLIYSNYRTLEGIGLLRLILLMNGYAEFKLVHSPNGTWDYETKEEDRGKPRFVLYTGTETIQEKEIIRNIYNSNWTDGTVPQNIVEKLRKEGANNHFGEVIRVLMITSSGAEGIDLKNTRFVHIVESYWNMVRVEQVVGRARRICSHQDLPSKYRTVQVFYYRSKFSLTQTKDDDYKELMIHDISRIEKERPMTTDETLFEISSIKAEINGGLLHAIKETAIDCNIYQKKGKGDGKDKGENLVCYGSQYGEVKTNAFSSFRAIPERPPAA
jgi:hypothetical protein